MKIEWNSYPISSILSIYPIHILPHIEHQIFSTSSRQLIHRLIINTKIWKTNWKPPSFRQVSGNTCRRGGEGAHLGGCALTAVRQGRISHQCQFQRSESVHSTVTLKPVDIYRPGQPNLLSGLCDPHHESHTRHRHTPGLVRFADNSYPSILILGGWCATRATLGN